MDIPTDKQNQSLASKSISAFKWNTLERLIWLSLQLIILAKLFDPESYISIEPFLID